MSRETSGLLLYMGHMRTIIMASGYRQVIVDHDGETGVISLGGPNMTAATFDAVAALIETLGTAIDGITLGTLGRKSVEAIVDPGSAALPADPFAQREFKWVVEYTDTTTGKTYRREIPTANLALLVPGTEMMDISAGAGLAFVTAFEAYVTSEVGNVIEVDRVVFVARDL